MQPGMGLHPVLALLAIPSLTWTGASGFGAAVELAHASFNATGQLVATDHDWTRYAAVLLLGIDLARLASTGRVRTSPGGLPIR
jgi:hypothetical protein